MCIECYSSHPFSSHALTLLTPVTYTVLTPLIPNILSTLFNMKFLVPFALLAGGALARDHITPPTVPTVPTGLPGTVPSGTPSGSPSASAGDCLADYILTRCLETEKPKVRTWLTPSSKSLPTRLKLTLLPRLMTAPLLTMSVCAEPTRPSPRKSSFRLPISHLGP